MVLAFAGDSTITSRPRPGPETAALGLVFVDDFEDFAAARRGFVDADSGMMDQGLRARRVLAKRERGVDECGGTGAANGAER